MLVLSRKRDETIELQGGVVKITVVEIRGDKVRIGVSAPPEVTVHRGEVADAIRRNGGVEFKRPKPLPVPAAPVVQEESGDADAAKCAGA